jgi:hypothetical protein
LVTGTNNHCSEKALRGSRGKRGTHSVLIVALVRALVLSSFKISVAILLLLFIDKLPWPIRVWRRLLRKEDTRRSFSRYKTLRVKVSRFVGQRRTAESAF